MTRSPLTRRYARALFELARDQNRLASVEADVQAIVALTRDRDALNEWLLDPRAARQRVKLCDALLADKVDPLTLRFVHFVLDKGRGSLLGEMAEDFIDICCEERGIQRVEIVSATPLSDAQINRIVQRFSARIQRTLQPSVRVDPTLIGGFRVRIRDTIYDFSLNHQLEHLHRSLLTA